MNSTSFANLTDSLLSDSQPIEKELTLVNYLVNSSPLALDLAFLFFFPPPVKRLHGVLYSRLHKELISFTAE